MKIVPVTSVEYLRHTPSDNASFPNPFEATQEQFRSVLYVAECWSDDNGIIDYDFNTERLVVTFDEIEKSFDKWDQSVEECPYDNVYDYLADCIDNGIHPCKLL